MEGVGAQAAAEGPQEHPPKSGVGIASAQLTVGGPGHARGDQAAADVDEISAAERLDQWGGAAGPPDPVVLVDQRGDQRGVLFAGGTQLGDRASDGRRKVIPGVVEPDARVVVVRSDAQRVGLALRDVALFA